MNKKQKFENFLESLKGTGQDTLIESVKQGFQVCFEVSDIKKDEEAVKHIKRKDFEFRENDWSLKLNPVWSTGTREFVDRLIKKYGIKAVRDGFKTITADKVQDSQNRREAEEAIKKSSIEGSGGTQNKEFMISLIEKHGKNAVLSVLKSIGKKKFLQNQEKWLNKISEFFEKKEANIENSESSEMAGEEGIIETPVGNKRKDLLKKGTELFKNNRIAVIRILEKITGKNDDDINYKDLLTNRDRVEKISKAEIDNVLALVDKAEKQLISEKKNSRVDASFLK